MMKKILTILVTAAMILTAVPSLAENGQSDQTADTFSVAVMGNGNSQQPPVMPDGSNDQQNGQQPPAMPDGSNDQQNGQQPPAMPDGSNSQQNGQQPPAMPDGSNSQQNGQKPPAMPGGGNGHHGQHYHQQPGPRPPMQGSGNSQQNGHQPPAVPDGNMPGESGGMQGGPGGMDAPAEYSAANEISENCDGGEYQSTSDSENAVLVSGKEIAITDATVVKSGSSDGENADFYGINAAVLAKDGAVLTISGTTVTSDGTHANGIFSYGAGTTVNVSDTEIRTTGDNSGGLMTTGGAAMNAVNVSASTSGHSSAAIRSDRGGGTVNVTGGKYTTTGVGSPAIYSTAEITVSGAALSAANSEAIVIEGGNSVTLSDVSISGNDATLNGQSTQKTNVLIYQSMSGDASEGASVFTMTGGSMTAETGSMFHVTNVTTTINLENVAFTYAADSNVFLDASADAWGRSGANGGNVTLNLTNQAISGAILSDSVSSVTVNLDGSSTWMLQGDSAVAAFSGDLANVDLNGYTLYIDGVAVTK